MTIHRISIRKLNQRANEITQELRAIRHELLKREQRKAKTADVVVERVVLEIVKNRAA